METGGRQGWDARGMEKEEEACPGEEDLESREISRMPRPQLVPRDSGLLDRTTTRLTRQLIHSTGHQIICGSDGIEVEVIVLYYLATALAFLTASNCL